MAVMSFFMAREASKVCLAGTIAGGEVVSNPFQKRRIFRSAGHGIQAGCVFFPAFSLLEPFIWEIILA
jgi:hypothetical protein